MTTPLGRQLHPADPELHDGLDAAAFERSWAPQVCTFYKAMLMTGSRTPRPRAFYRACGFSADAKTAYLAGPS
jgi:hypothetical protein